MSRMRLPEFAVGPVTVVAAVVAAGLTAASDRYGFHRDELYFLVAGAHPDWGYVDQPPLTPLLATMSTTLFGGTPAGLRVFATLACVATVVMVALVARELGGGRTAQLLAACGSAVSSYVLVIGHMVSTSTFDMLIWLVICWLSLRLLRTGDGRWWILLGVVVGIGLQNKHLVGLLVIALLISVAALGPRHVLRSRWFPVGVVLAALLFAPNLWWQAVHGWPQLEVSEWIGASSGAENRLLFVPEQLYQLSPLLVPVWIAGLVRLWRDPGLRWARSFGLAYPVLCVLVLPMGGKSYYVFPLLLVLLAAGCEPVASWLRRGRIGLRRAVIGVGLAVALAISAVVALPVLPTSAVAAVNEVNGEQGEQVGWPTLVRAVADGWAEIPSAQRDRAVILTANYGQAGAIAHYGAEYDLPMPYSGHMSFADWGPPPDSANGPVLLVGVEPPYFRDCRRTGAVDNGFGLENDEQGTAIVLCPGTAEPWSTLWPKLRHVD